MFGCLDAQNAGIEPERIPREPVNFQPAQSAKGCQNENLEKFGLGFLQLITSQSDQRFDIDRALVALRDPRLKRYSGKRKRVGQPNGLQMPDGIGSK